MVRDTDDVKELLDGHGVIAVLVINDIADMVPVAESLLESEKSEGFRLRDEEQEQIRLSGDAGE